MQVEVTSMSKGRESHTLFLRELRYLGRREAQETGAEFGGFLGMCVCLYLCVCTLPDTLLGPKYLWGLCVAVTVLHNVFT